MYLPQTIMNDRRANAVARMLLAGGGRLWVYDQRYRLARNTVLWFLDGVKPVLGNEVYQRQRGVE